MEQSSFFKKLTDLKDDHPYFPTMARMRMWGLQAWLTHIHNAMFKSSVVHVFLPTIT